MLLHCCSQREVRSSIGVCIKLIKFQNRFYYDRRGIHAEISIVGIISQSLYSSFLDHTNFYQLSPDHFLKINHFVWVVALIVLSPIEQYFISCPLRVKLEAQKMDQGCEAQYCCSESQITFYSIITWLTSCFQISSSNAASQISKASRILSVARSLSWLNSNTFLREYSSNLDASPYKQASTSSSN